MLGQLLTTGRVRRRYLGVTARTRPIPRLVARHLHLAAGSGIERALGSWRVGAPLAVSVLRRIEVLELIVVPREAPA